MIKLTDICFCFLLFSVVFVHCKDNEKSTIRANLVQGTFTNNEANSHCQLAGKQRTDSLNNVTFDTDNSHTGLVWIGAVQKHTSWFAFHGCHSITRSMIDKSTSSSNNQLSTCEQFCNYNQYVALRGSQCFCLTGLSKMRPSQLLRLLACPGNMDDFCGEELPVSLSNSTAIDVFVYNKADVSGTTGTCMTSKKSGLTYMYEPGDCDTRMSFICKYSYYTYAGYNNVNIYIGYVDRVGTWVEVMDKCYSEYTDEDDGRYSSLSNIYDMSNTSSNDFIPENKSLWTGIFRRGYFVWQQDTESGNCVAANLSVDGTFFPQSVSCDMKLPVLCDVMVSSKTPESMDIGIITLSVFILLLVIAIFVGVIVFIRKKNVSCTHNKLKLDHDPAPALITQVTQVPTRRKVSFHLTEEQYAKVLSARESNDNTLNERNQMYKATGDAIYDHVTNQESNDIYDHCNVGNQGDKQVQSYDPTTYDKIHIEDNSRYNHCFNKELPTGIQEASLNYDSINMSAQSDHIGSDKAILIPGNEDEYIYLENTQKNVWKFKH